MKKPLYHIFYTRSPIAKIGWGILSVVATLVIVLLILVTEESRMAAQTENWEGRSIEKGAALYANNCASCHAADGKGASGPALHSRYFFTQRADDVDWAGSQANYIRLTLQAGRPSKVNTQWGQIMPTWGRDFGGPLRDDQINSLVDYLMNWESTALEQTPEEDPWKFFQDSLTKALPYEEDEPGYEAKLEQAIAAAELSGARRYTLNDVEYEFEQASGDEVARSPQELWTAVGCSGCHMIDQDQTADNVGAVAPHQNNLWERAGEQVEGLSAEEYVYQSIVEPNAHIATGYQANVMPGNFGEILTEAELDGLVAWLLDPNRSLEVPEAEVAEAPAEESATETTAEEASTADDSASAEDDGSAGEAAVETDINVIATDLLFNGNNGLTAPTVWTVPSGEEVTLTLDNQGDVEHSWAVVTADATIPVPFDP